MLKKEPPTQVSDVTSTTVGVEPSSLSAFMISDLTDENESNTKKELKCAPI